MGFNNLSTSAMMWISFYVLTAGTLENKESYLMWGNDVEIGLL